MQSTRCKVPAWIVAPAILFLTGCFGPPNLPAELDVALPMGASARAEAGSGASLLADSSWSAFRKADTSGAGDASDGTSRSPYGGLLNGGFLVRSEPDTVMYRVHFGAGGQAERISENAFYLPGLFGTEFFVDDSFHTTPTPGVSYAAIAFGVEQGQQFGIAITVEVRFLGIPLGTALVFAWGTIDVDRLDGTFGYQADLYAIPDALLGSGADQYPFYAERASDGAGE